MIQSIQQSCIVYCHSILKYCDDDDDDDDNDDDDDEEINYIRLRVVDT